MASYNNHELEYSMPEMIFHEWTDEDRKDETFAKCPLCNNFADSFYCADCVKNGNFTYSKKKCIERSFMFRHLLSRFADRKPKKFKLEEEKANLLKRYESDLAKKLEIENLKLAINSCKEKIAIVKKNINISKNEILKGEKTIESLKEKKNSSSTLQENLSCKLRDLRESQKLENANLSIKESTLNTEQCALQSLKNKRLNELVEDIFPITEIDPQHHSDKDQCTELEEAQKTTYVQGQWVIAGTSTDKLEYKVVFPCIPSTGDYSAYPAWCVAFEKYKSCGDVEISTDTLSSEDKLLFDKAYGISGALSYAAQMVNIMSFYLGVHLPKRSSMNDFFKDECVEKFNHNVAKLNANIINLCLFQNVDVSELSAHRTISNLLLLKNSKKNESKRYLSIEKQENLLESLEDSIFKDIPHFDESDNNSEAEFVHVSDEDIVDVPKCEPAASVSKLISIPDNDNSETEFIHLSLEDILQVPQFEPVPKPPESLMSSVVSFWKGFGGTK